MDAAHRQLGLKPGPGLVGADHADEIDRRAERANVVRHVRRPAEPVLVVIVDNDGHRCFR